MGSITELCYVLIEIRIQKLERNQFKIQNSKFKIKKAKGKLQKKEKWNNGKKDSCKDGIMFYFAETLQLEIEH